jgi:hypothetical protein
MKIVYQKKIVALTPDTAEERVMLQAVWRLLIDCNGEARKLAPIGEFVTAKHHPAQFVIEGPGAEKLPEYPLVVVDEDCKVCCDICNRMQDLKRGDKIPLCCGKMMEFMD